MPLPAFSRGQPRGGGYDLKTTKRGWLVGVMALIVATSTIGGMAANGSWPRSRVTAEGGVLPGEVQEMVLEALAGPEGEHAAYATYSAIIDTYGEVNPFTNIMESEAYHIEALTSILDAYDVSYPGENPYLGAIEVPESLAAAAQAGVDAELANVDLYQRQLEAVSDYPEIYNVFVSLQSASLNQHMPAFERAVERYGS